MAIAATSAVFPVLQAHGHGGDRAAVRRLHDQTHLGIAFVALPASFGLAVLSYPISNAVFGHGAFGPEGVERMHLALRWLCLAILPAGATGLVARTYYSLGDFKTPVRVSIAMLASNVALNTLFLVGFGMDVEGLALATALTSFGNVALLWPGLTRKLDLPAGSGDFAVRMLRVVSAAALSAGAAWGVHALAAPHLGRALPLLMAILAGAVVHGVASIALGVPEAREAGGQAGTQATLTGPAGVFAIDGYSRVPAQSDESMFVARRGWLR